MCFRFEEVTAGAISGLVQNPPTCLFDLVENPGIRTMHAYVDEYIVTCPTQ